MLHSLLDLSDCLPIVGSASSLSIFSSVGRFYRPLVLVVKCGVLLFTTGCSIFGVESVEEAAYSVVSTDGQFEVRDYAPTVVAETRIKAGFKQAGNQAFRRLFGYISGANESRVKISMTAPVVSELDLQDKSTGEKIAMTAPVLSQRDGDAYRYRFVLPAKFKIDNAPSPSNPEVTLISVPGARVATYRYSGINSADKQTTNAKKLLAWVESQGLVPKSAPRWAGYNSPWALPPLRRNEVLIDVAQ